VLFSKFKSALAKHDSCKVLHHFRSDFLNAIVSASLRRYYRQTLSAGGRLRFFYYFWVKDMHAQIVGRRSIGSLICVCGGQKAYPRKVPEAQAESVPMWELVNDTVTFPETECEAATSAFNPQIARERTKGTLPVMSDSRSVSPKRFWQWQGAEHRLYAKLV